MRMMVLTALAAALLYLGACASFPLFGMRSANQVETGPAEATSSSATIELQDIDYTGEDLRGRLLISAVGGTIQIDKRLIENISLSLRGVSECASGQELFFIKAGVVAPPRREEDILALEPGYWYGKDVRIALFDQHLLEGQGQPECIDVDLIFYALEGRSAQLRVRATRPPLSAMDAGVPAPDAGGSSTPITP